MVKFMGLSRLRLGHTVSTEPDAMCELDKELVKMHVLKGQIATEALLVLMTPFGFLGGVSIKHGRNTDRNLE